MGQTKQVTLGDWIFELNYYDCDKATILLPELTVILTSPIESGLEKIKSDIRGKTYDEIFKSDVADMAGMFGKLLGSFSQVFTGALKPSDLPEFLKRILAEVRCKNKNAKNATWVNLESVYSTVFTGRIMDQFTLAKEVLLFNFQGEFNRFFGSLLGSLGIAKEASNNQSPTTSTQAVGIQAR